MDRDEIFREIRKSLSPDEKLDSKILAKAEKLTPGEKNIGTHTKENDNMSIRHFEDNEQSSENISLYKNNHATAIIAAAAVLMIIAAGGYSLLKGDMTADDEISPAAQSASLQSEAESQAQADSLPDTPSEAGEIPPDSAPESESEEDVVVTTVTAVIPEADTPEEGTEIGLPATPDSQEDVVSPPVTEVTPGADGSQEPESGQAESDADTLTLEIDTSYLGLDGSYVFDVYREGALAYSYTMGANESKAEIELTGEGSETLEVYIRDLDSGEYTHFATYEVDYDLKTVSCHDLLMNGSAVAEEHHDSSEHHDEHD